MVSADFLVLFDDADAEVGSEPVRPPWLVLVVDDDPDVAAVTRMVMAGCRFEGGEIKVLAANSVTEAQRMLKAHPEIAVVLLDVVMETEDAGLRLVSTIRTEFDLRALRIILHTGQPGYAPERAVICRYDINDYRVKGEVTAHSLYTSVIAALRGYAEISARIQAEREAVLAARSKAQFLSSLSHELRTPLNAIIGFAEVIARQGFSPAREPRYLDYIHAISDNGRQLLAVLNALLAMARIDAGRYELCEQVIEVDTLLAAALSAASERAAAAGVTLVARPSPVPSLLADSAALAQILDNLLSNAIKFSPSRSTVELSVAYGQHGGPVISVADRGIGIPGHRLGDLFLQFSQLDAGINRRFNGIGLGLAIVKGLVTLHGGTVEVASVHGEGTTVSVVLPAFRLVPDYRTAMDAAPPV
ncbi:MAG: hybrid sensor histidine kinase/response regulator [Rhodospirillaceae bacterium]